MTAVYKIELLVIDHDNIGSDAVIDALEGSNYANDCIAPRAMSFQSRDIGPWDDANPLNHSGTAFAEFRRLFDPAASLAAREEANG